MHALPVSFLMFEAWNNFHCFIYISRQCPLDPFAYDRAAGPATIMYVVKDTTFDLVGKTSFLMLCFFIYFFVSFCLPFIYSFIFLSSFLFVLSSCVIFDILCCIMVSSSSCVILTP